MLALASGASTIIGAFSKKADPGLYAALGRAKSQRKMDIGRANLKGLNDAIAISDDYRAVADKIINDELPNGIRSSYSQGAVLDSSLDKLSQNAHIAYLTTKLNVSIADQAGKAEMAAIQKAIKKSGRVDIGSIISGGIMLGGGLGLGG